MAELPKELTERYGIQPHATRKQANGYIGVGASITAVSFFCTGQLLGLGISLGTVGLACLALGIYLRRTGTGVQVVNRAFHEATVGRTEDAATLLDYAEEHYTHGPIGRAIDLQRALLALRRGDFEEAQRRADAAVQRQLSVISRTYEEAHVVAAIALRAFSSASLGRTDAALADIEAVRASAAATPEAIARAEVAQALVLERSGRLDELRAHLVSHRYVLHEHTQPRERAIVRAYERMLQAKPQSVYRKKAEDAPAGAEPSLKDWVATVAPGASPFVRTSTTNEARGAPTAAASPPGAKKAAQARVAALAPKKTARGARLIVLWILLVVLFFAIYSLLPADDAASVPSVDLSFTSSLVGLTFALFVIGYPTLLVLRHHRHARALRIGLVELARDDEPAATETLQRVGKSSTALVAAQAHGALARLALRAGRFQEALNLINVGLGKLGKTQRAAASDWVLPDLLSDRAAILAALGRVDDGRAELSLIADTYTSYPFMARSELRVTLMEAASRGDIATAASLDQAADLAISSRDELLIDLARAAANPGSAGAGEVERLKHTLRADPSARAWVERIAPTFIPAFEEATRIG